MPINDHEPPQWLKEQFDAIRPVLVDMARLDDEIDFAALDVASKTAFGIIDAKRRVIKWWRHQTEVVRAARTRNPILFDQMVVIVAASAVEIVASWLKRR